MTAHRLATRANLRRIDPAIFHVMRALFALLTAAAVVPASAWPVRRWPRAIPKPSKSRRRRRPAQGRCCFARTGQGPFPAVVGLHNCTGLSNSRRRDGRALPRLGRAPRQGRLRRAAARQQRLARASAASAACAPRSLRTDRERVADADAARAWLQAQAWVAPDRVSLLGWSSGAHRRAVGGARAAAAAGARTAPISARRSRSIRAAGGSATPPGARGCRR